MSKRNTQRSHKENTGRMFLRWVGQNPRFRNNSTKTAKSRQTDVSPVAKLRAVENEMEATSNGQDD
jgi:hypothetical protein